MFFEGNLKDNDIAYCPFCGGKIAEEVRIYNIPYVRKKVNRNVNKVKKFSPPSIEEIEEYIAKNNYHVNAETFLKYFTEGNWVDSKGNKVRNWKQKIITWEGRNGQTGRGKQPIAKKERGIRFQSLF